SLGGKIGWFEINAEVGKMRDILPKSVHDQVIVAAGPNVTARVPAWYEFLNFRLAPTSGGVRPFVTVGGGGVQLRPQLSPSATGVTATLFPTNSRTKAALTAGAGIEVGLSRVAVVDLGYRYLRVYSDYKLDTNFSNDSVLTNVNCLYASLGFR